MQRNEWKFDYTANRLAEAAQGKITHHQERLAAWQAKREEVLARIRAEGLEIDEKLVLGYHSPKSRDWEGGNRIRFREDLRRNLEEVLDKLKHHTEQVQQYQGWHQLLTANAEVRLGLDVEDWLFFFGRS